MDNTHGRAKTEQKELQLSTIKYIHFLNQQTSGGLIYIVMSTKLDLNSSLRM